MPSELKTGPRLDWQAYAADLAALSRLDGAAPGPEMRAERKRLEDALLAGAPDLPHDGQRATVLEVAVQVASMRLVQALRPVGSKDLAVLTPEQWAIFTLKDATPDLLRAAMSRDLSLLGLLDSIWDLAIRYPEWRAFLLQDVSQNRWWLPITGKISSWFLTCPDSALASEFLRRQVSGHPIRAKNALVMTNDHHVHILDQVILHRAGVEMPDWLRDRFQEKLKSEPSNHARMKLLEQHASLEAIHQNFS